MRHHGRVWLGALAAFGTLACGSNRTDRNQMSQAVQACLPPEGRLPADADPGSWAGEYQLTLVTTFGDSAGRQTTGLLSLTGMPAELRGGGELTDTTVALELYGTTEVDPNVVNAVAVGQLASSDPSQPGVLVISRQTAAGPEVTIRLGSEANRRGMTRFDGGYWALQVLEAGPAGLRGTWSSGVTNRNSAGHFCAVPVNEDG